MSKRFADALRQMAALVDFMLGDGREAFDLLSGEAQRELRDLFDALNDELQGHADREERHV